MKARRKHKPSAEVNLGFQIAPMIDVVFVIMLYFMVMAGAVQVENAHNTKLPGTIQGETDTPLPDEIAVRIEDDGQVYLNDDPGMGPTYGFYTEENAGAKAIFDAWLGALGDLGVKRNPVDKIGIRITSRSRRWEFRASPRSRTTATTMFARITRTRISTSG